MVGFTNGEDDGYGRDSRAIFYLSLFFYITIRSRISDACSLSYKNNLRHCWLSLSLSGLTKFNESDNKLDPLKSLDETHTPN